MAEPIIKPREHSIAQRCATAPERAACTAAPHQPPSVQRTSGSTLPSLAKPSASACGVICGAPFNQALSSRVSRKTLRPPAPSTKQRMASTGPTKPSLPVTRT